MGQLVRAVFLDALGTLIELEPPWPRLQRELKSRFGLGVTLAVSERAMRAEMAYYRGHCLAARDAASLAALRRDCAAVLRGELAASLEWGSDRRQAAEVPLAELTEALLASLRFRAYPDARGAVDELRALRLGLVVVSNWDCELPAVLEQVGLAGSVDAVLASAAVGSTKPDAGIFRRALEVAGVAASEAVHVGDSVEADVAGARAAGIKAVLVERRERPVGARLEGVPVVRSLAELPATIGRAGSAGPHSVASKGDRA